MTGLQTIASKKLHQRTNPLILPLFFIALVMFSLTAFAKPGAGQPDDGPSSAGQPAADKKGHFNKVCSELNLSPEQKEKLKTIRKAHRDTITPLRQKKSTAAKKLREGFKSGATTESLRATHKEIAALHAQMSDARFENALAIREILTAEQRQKFDLMKGEVRNRFKDRIRSLVDEEEETEE